MRINRSINVLSGGLASGLANHAVDRRNLSHCAARHYCELLRFYRSTPTVSLGLHQELLREVRTDYCRTHHIEIARRCSEGPALYLDPGQLGFTLVVRRPKAWRDWNLNTLLSRFSRGIIRGLAKLGVSAQTDGTHDITANGRRIASVFAATRDGAVLLQGTLCLRMDVPTTLHALRLPTEKLSRDGLAAAADRFTSMEDALGREAEPCSIQSAFVDGLAMELHLRFRAADGTGPEYLVELAELADEEVHANSVRWGDDDAAVEGFVRTPRGTLHARATFGPGGFADTPFATDILVDPPTLIEELQDVLRGMPPALLDGCVRFIMRRAAATHAGWQSGDLLGLLRQLAEKHEMRKRQRFSTAEVNALMPYPAGTGLGVGETLNRAGTMLVPYCAKPSWCEWRHQDRCLECGKCEVGGAYRLARERGMQVTTILNYEHLETTLAAMKANGTAAFVGMCCRHFLIKRHHAFAVAGLPAVLMDISGANCYELQQERAAYAGKFTAESRLDGRLLEKVMDLVPATTVESAA